MKSDAVFELADSDRPAFLVNAAGEIILANPSAARLFGASLEKEAILLSTVWSAENNLPAEKFLAELERSAAPATPMKFSTQDDSSRIFSVAVCPFASGEEKYFIFQLFPAVPEPKNQTAEANLAQKQKLDCALRLARTVSLDFNNALTSILGHTSLLLSKAEPEHPWRRSLMEVEKAAAKAAEITNELAVFSQQEKVSRTVPAGNLNTVVNRCVEFFRNKKAGETEWKMRLERELFISRFNEASVQQAFTKILENAVESVNGSAQIVVQSHNVELAEASQDRNVRLAPGAYVCVEVSDNGCGIPTDMMPRIFEPFFTTKRGGHRGLGLALVYGIVTNHGGGVAVSSQPGAGTSVRVYLPAERRFVHESAGADENLRGTGTVLVVDDESLLLTMAETILTDYGYHVLTANSGQEAIRIFSREDAKIDLVITDLVMPGISGRELVEHIKQISPDTPVFCTSGCVLPEEQQTEMYLQKPFTSEGLLIKVKEALGSID
jgi:two-component system cell cycle sensor histidine kinase/response regulator CckA